jgi:hypothetical protein
MSIALAVGVFMAGGLVGFAAACLCRVAADEPHGIPRGEDPFRRNTVTMPPRSRAGMMADPFEASTWDD